MFLLNNIRYIFTVLINVTQIDIALFSILVEQIIVMITIKMLLNEKKFTHKEVSVRIIELETIKG
jgi:hypothetical protein